MSDEAPGGVMHFLKRASTEELRDTKRREENLGRMFTRWKLLQMIDEELDIRSAEERRKMEENYVASQLQQYAMGDCPSCMRTPDDIWCTSGEGCIGKKWNGPRVT